MENNYPKLVKVFGAQILLCVGMLGSFRADAHEIENHRHSTISSRDNSVYIKNNTNGVIEQNDQSNQTVVSITKGSRVELNIKNVCDRLIKDCDVERIFVHEGPAEGILFPIDPKGKAFYQHAGTSDNTDVIVFEYKNLESGLSKQFSIVIDVDSSLTKLVIISPGLHFQTSKRQVTVSFKVEGKDYDHIHMSLNSGVDHISVYGREGSHTFKDLRAGENRIEVSLARKDHRPIPQSTQTIVFNVTR